MSAFFALFVLCRSGELLHSQFLTPNAQTAPNKPAEGIFGMKTVLQKDNLGMVLSMQSTWNDAGQSPMSGHLILNRLRVDDEGNICLSSPDGFQGILDQVEQLKFELDQLANETVLWLAKSIAARRPRLSVVASND